MSRILIIDDDRALCRVLQLQLQMENHTVSTAYSGNQGLKTFTEQPPELVMLDLGLPDENGLDTLEKIQAMDRSIPIIVITGQHEMKPAIDAMRAGAFDYLRKPLDLDAVLSSVGKAYQWRLDQIPAASASLPAQTPDMTAAVREIVGHDRRILEVIKNIGLFSLSRINILVEGESGTGKELVARALHEATHSDEPFVSVNCSSVVVTLFESELFGHEKGSFTGADSRKIGKLEHAGKGTVFLDEVGDMPMEIQPKLLRVLQEHEFERVGGVRPIPFQARVVAATHRDLAAMVREGRFREDLYFRLAVARLSLPPLRERPADIPLIARHLIRSITWRLHLPPMEIGPEAMQRLMGYHWPGNIRELENVLTRAVALNRGTLLNASDLDCPLPSPIPADCGEDLLPLEEVVLRHVLRVLGATGWNVTRSATILDISPTTLRKKIADAGLSRDHFIVKE